MNSVKTSGKYVRKIVRVRLLETQINSREFRANGCSRTYEILIMTVAMCT